MPKFAANLNFLFTEVPFLERFALARAAGFTAVEYPFPYDYDPRVLKERLEANGLAQVLFNMPPGDWAGGERGIAALPGRRGEFRAGVAKAVEYALALGVPRINCLAGIRSERRSDAEHWRTLTANVRYAAEVLNAHGLTLVVEFINRFDMPGFFLNRTALVLSLLDRVAMPNVLLQYDIYHAQREEGELVATLRRHIDRIGHIQLADNPGRHQPGTGEINYPFILAALDALGYQGHVGLEYIPSPDTASSLGWINRLGYGLSAGKTAATPK
ncbi:hydroxypyruvate isomerase [Anaeroselena agilis]|uniref:Hydroxypyruvate isomerase n=1 Tax=Anaeroselena agilis TaxID=3063788 RepID=A0ABU3P086_9FIRM|nr:hydroxypyruvate isomerase [Selenomonadales bacterium 4137-cl]